MPRVLHDGINWADFTLRPSGPQVPVVANKPIVALTAVLELLKELGDSL